MTGWMVAVVKWPLFASVLVVMAVSAFVPIVTVSLVRRYWPHPSFKENNEIVGFSYAVYGLVYGVLLAFTIVVAWQRFADTEQLVIHEATLLSELWRNSLAFPAPFRDNIQKDLMAYAQSVVEDEWPTMAERGQANPSTEAIYERLWALAYHLTPETPNQQAFMSEYLGRMNDLGGARRMRIMYSRVEVHGILWLVLVIGAIPTIGYTLLFSNKHAFVQMMIMGSIMLIVLLGLLVTVSLQHPFTGNVSIHPDAFQEMVDSFNQRLHSESVMGP